MTSGVGSPPSRPVYRGRFAPSPTGDLHFGSLVAALASYLDARSAGGQWLVRIDNLDPPREVKGSAVRILRALEAFSFEWDGPVMYQSERFEQYREIVEQLRADQLAYLCNCSRRQIAAIAKTGVEGHVYPGTCRMARHKNIKGKAVRLLTDDKKITFDDRIQGRLSQQVQSQFGDFVIRRIDDLFAYQLAVVADDREQGITDVVRGCDLLHSTTRQIHLQRRLGYPTPNYAHFPLAMDEAGGKLSKSNDALPVDPARPLATLKPAMDFLGQAEIPVEIETLADFWPWAIENWSLQRIPAKNSLVLDPRSRA